MIYYDLKQEANRKSIGDVVGRESEMKRIALSLQRQFNNNVLIRGSSGTGTTALIEGFAYRAAKGRLPGFEHSTIIKLDTNDLKKLFSQLSHQDMYAYVSAAFRSFPDDSIVIIDDFQNAVPERRLYELNQALEPFFENPRIRLVLGMSESGYQQLYQDYPNFFQFFEDINLKENDAAETKQILTALAPSFAREYGVEITAEAIAAIVELSQKVNSGKKFPLRAIHMFDESLAFAKISGSSKLTRSEVQAIFAEKTGVPSATLNQLDAELLRTLEMQLGAKVIGQPGAVKIVSDTVRRSRMGLRNPNRPYGSFLFLGPSGVGKTELSKVLAKIVYGSERAFTRIDMSEFTEAHTVQRLIGAPPGYIGFESGGQLTNAIKEQPYSLILLDEIEKAHGKIFDIFLQVLEDGRLSDGQGQVVNFTNSIVIATSNLGISEIVEAFKRGANVQDLKFTESVLMPILTRHFRLEFLNRFDAIIVFNPLSLKDLLAVAHLEIQKIEERTAQHNVKFNIEPAVLSAKISELIDYRFGARPVKRFIEQTCESLIALKIMGDVQKAQGKDRGEKERIRKEQIEEGLIQEDRAGKEQA